MPGTNCRVWYYARLHEIDCIAGSRHTSDVKTLYLGFTIVGAIVPCIFFAGYFSEHGVDLIEFCKQLFANNPASGFSADLLISSFCFWLWSYVDAKKANIAWWYVPVLNLSIGLSLALPLYFFFRASASIQPASQASPS